MITHICSVSGLKLFFVSFFPPDFCLFETDGQLELNSELKENLSFHLKFHLHRRVK